METERTYAAEQAAIFANGDKASQAVPSSPDASRPLPANRILHWLTIYVIIGIAGYVLTLLFNWIGKPLILSPRLYETLSPQTLFSALFIVKAVIQAMIGVLWIRLTYKRFAYSKAWRIFVLFDTLLTIALLYWSDSNTLKKMIEDASAAVLTVPVTYLVIGSLVLLFPLGYCGWILWKKQPQWKGATPIPKAPVPVSWRADGIHWAAALVAVSVLAILFYKITNLLGVWNGGIANAAYNELAQAAYNGIMISFLITMAVWFVLWMLLTRKRYADSVNWQACTLCSWIVLITLFYTVADAVIAQLKQEFGNWYGAATVSLTPGLIVFSVLVFLLLLLYYGRVIQNESKKRNERTLADLADPGA